MSLGEKTMTILGNDDVLTKENDDDFRQKDYDDFW